MLGLRLLPGVVHEVASCFVKAPLEGGPHAHCLATRQGPAKAIACGQKHMAKRRPVGPCRSLNISDGEDHDDQVYIRHLPTNQDEHSFLMINFHFDRFDRLKRIYFLHQSPVELANQCYDKAKLKKQIECLANMS